MVEKKIVKFDLKIANLQPDPALASTIPTAKPPSELGLILSFGRVLQNCAASLDRGERKRKGMRVKNDRIEGRI